MIWGAHPYFWKHPFKGSWEDDNLLFPGGGPFGGPKSFCRWKWLAWIFMPPGLCVWKLATFLASFSKKLEALNLNSHEWLSDLGCLLFLQGLSFEHDIAPTPPIGFFWRRQDAILFGVETHVCVQQTALDLMDRGIQAVKKSTGPKNPSRYSPENQHDNGKPTIWRCIWCISGDFPASHVSFRVGRWGFRESGGQDLVVTKANIFCHAARIWIQDMNELFLPVSLPA